ncbi:MAG: hemolysin family protein [Cyclobacteriaceae bacterium]|nr:hemolysin family protein [Cyclobacteriaceae bacterium]
MEAYLVLIIVMLLLSAFFSGIEIAFISSDKLQLEIQAKKIPVAGRFLSYFIQNQSHFMGVTLVGNTLALVLFGMFITEFLRPFIFQLFPMVEDSELLFFIIQTIISTLIVLFSAEFLPKSIFLINPNRMMTVFAFPLMVMYWILYLPMVLVVSLSRFMLTRVFGLEYAEDKPVYGLTDLNNYLKNMVELSERRNSKIGFDTKILNNALEFKTVKIRDCMIPRTEVSAVDIEDGVEELSRMFTESGHSKILVYKESIDDVIGYCHVLDMFKKPKKIQDFLAPIIIVPEAMLASELMIQFINERKSLALVADEYGGTSGVVSMEDIIEEIFGEIKDEHDDEEFVEMQVDERTWLLSARLEIDYLNDKYGWDLPEGEYETLGGMILNIIEDMPKISEHIELQHYSIQINTLHDTKIGTVKLKMKD